MQREHTRRPWEGEEFKRLLVAGEGRDEGALTLQGFLSKWAYTTSVDPVHTLAYLRYLGYQGSAAGFFSISRPRRQERKQEQILRSTLRVSPPPLLYPPCFFTNLAEGNTGACCRSGFCATFQRLLCRSSTKRTEMRNLGSTPVVHHFCGFSLVGITDRSL